MATYKSHLIKGIIPPNFAPTDVSQHYINTAAKKVYLSVGTTDANDWKEVMFATAIQALIDAGDAAAAKYLARYKAYAAVSSDTVLTEAQMGLVNIDGTSSDKLITLPLSDSTLGVSDVIVRRVDNSGNKVKILAAGTDKIKFHTHLNSNGYSFFVLMGAGDYWHLRSDGNGSWFPIARLDSTPLGRPTFETIALMNPGGYGTINGPIFNRAEWPWLWDHAQQSGMIVTEATRSNFEGCWTSGDNVSTFRGPEWRGEFIRAQDEGRGIDTNRAAGSFQLDAFKSHTHTNYITGQKSGANAPGADSAVYGGGAQTSATGGTETRPRNIAYPGRIKVI